MTAPDHIAAGDCELSRGRWLGQPANALSSLSYVAAGSAMVATADRHPERRRGIERALGWATVAAGWGSVAYHGPGGSVSRVAHDASLLTMLGLLVAADVAVLRPELTPPTPVLAAVPVAALAASRSRHNLLAQGLVGGAAVVVEAVRLRRAPDSARRRAEPAVVALAGALHWSGRADAPLCRPRSWLQAHALWHAATAATLWLRATEVEER